MTTYLRLALALILVAAALLGIVVTWACLTYRLRLRAIVMANLLGLIFVMVRIMSPDTSIPFFSVNTTDSARLGHRASAASNRWGTRRRQVSWSGMLPFWCSQAVSVNEGRLASKFAGQPQH